MAKIMRAKALFFQNKYFEKIAAVLTTVLFLLSISLIVRSCYLSKTLIPLYEQKLQKKLDDQVAAIKVFLNGKKAHTDALAHDRVILDYLNKIHLRQEVSPAEQEAFSNYIAKRRENAGFKSLSLITGGTVVFSTNKLLRNVHLRDERYSNTPLFRSYFVATLGLVTDFSDFLYSTTIKEPAFYITRPLFRDNKIIGNIAYQVDEQELNVITRDYLDLGATGEIVLAVQTASQATIITPTRNAPSIRFIKEELFAESKFVPMQRAARGEIGHGITIDYRGEKTLAAWSFIPRVDWGVVVKIDFKEIMEPVTSANKYIIIFSILTLIFAAVTAFLHSKKLSNKLSTIRTKIFGFIPQNIKLLEILLLSIFIVLSVLSIYQYEHSISSALKKSQDLAIHQVENGISSIENDLEQIRHLADFIAQDLRTERLISGDIRKRLRREIVETDGLVRITIAYAPYNYSNEKRLFAPSITQKEDGSIEEEMIDEMYDYTDKNEGISRTRWYTQAMETQKPEWLNPSIDPLSKTMVITYALPFFFDKEKTPAGVIAINYKLSNFAEIAQYIGVGKTGYTFIVSSDQMFLHHPIMKNIFEGKRLLQFAQEEGNRDLEYIAKEIREGKVILKQFSSGSKTSWIYTRPISITGWTIATVFSANEIGLPPSLIKDYIFNVTIYISITALILLYIICRMYTKNSLGNFLNLSNIIFIFILIFLWYTIEHSSNLDSNKNIIMTDQSSVNKFVNKQIQEAARKNEPTPIPIPCGIELYSLQQTNPISVSFSGYIWHRYHKALHKDIQRIIRIPQATYFTVLNETTVSEGDWDIVELNISATIYHEHDYSQYPFEAHNIVIPIEHADIGKNILLVPDLDAYTSINPRNLPGLDTTFSLTSFYTTDTFFDYTPHTPKSDLGVRTYKELSDQYRMAFNAVIDVELLAPFIYFFLPLLVILITIFAVLMLENRDTSPFNTIGPYTGLFFALVLLHRSLHEAAPSTNTLYMEYAFFYTYIVLILLVVHTVLMERFSKSSFYQVTTLSLLKTIFWPLQLTAWIITTLIIFY